MISLVICSPVPALRAGLSALISGDDDLCVVEAVSRLPDTLPPGVQVVVATTEALDLADAVLTPEVALLLVVGSGPEDQREARALPGLGLKAWGIISSEAGAEALRAAVRALVEGLVVVSPDSQHLLLGSFDPAEGDLERPAGEGMERPTERESEVLQLLAQGLTNKQIALALHISEHTAKFHVSSIYGKLGASNRTEAVRKGARRGWVAL
jgi:DNA-binding NarL/FixJ family response regulator